jgi:xylan 1,4-beta-xylosidase
MALLTNPVLPGFTPDPSLIRVDGWYYLANSSFEWHPTIPIHRSRDLKTWEFAGSLNGPDVDLDLRRLQDSGGVWAPSLSWCDGSFWLTFTVVRGFGGPHKDMDTYISRAADVAGPWTAPARVTSTGFDPSIFHHGGRHWLVNMEWDHRPNGRGSFAGINVQELNADGTATVGQPRILHRRPELVEGPNLYFIEGRFYLMLAEGGTGQNHGIAMMRSENILGPYEPDPNGPVLTTRDNPAHELQKAGHGEIATSADGTMYLAHLASRWAEKDGHRYSILGRETCIQRLALTPDGWLRLEQGGWHPAVTVEGPQEETPASPHNQPDPDTGRDPGAILSWDNTVSTGATPAWPWSTLRQPPGPDWASLTARPGWLRLRGRHSTDSVDTQSLVARRLTSTTAKATVTVEAEPENYTHSAGLIFYYNTSSYVYLRTTVRETGGIFGDGDMDTEKVVEVLENDPLTGLRSHGTVPVPAGVPLRLEGSLADDQLHFSWAAAGCPLQPIGPAFNALQLSDDHGDVLRFTGTLVGVAAQDLRDRTFTADFTDFTYRDA